MAEKIKGPLAPKATPKQLQEEKSTRSLYEESDLTANVYAMGNKAYQGFSVCKVNKYEEKLSFKGDDLLEISDGIQEEDGAFSYALQKASSNTYNGVVKDKARIDLLINNEPFNGQLAIQADFHTKAESSGKTVIIKQYFLVDLDVFNMYVDILIHEEEASALSSKYFKRLKRKKHCTLSS